MERLEAATLAFIRYDLRAESWPAYAVFAVGSGVFGLAIVVLDACSVALSKDRYSYLGLTHGWQATPKAALVWVIGSMIGSTLGLLAHIFEPTPLAAVLASLTWRTLLAQLHRLGTHNPPPKPPGD